MNREEFIKKLERLSFKTKSKELEGIIWLFKKTFNGKNIMNRDMYIVNNCAMEGNNFTELYMTIEEQYS